MQERGATGFAALQVAPQTLAAFEKSSYPDDWRELMRRYLVRRTRSFIKRHYAKSDPERNRHYLEFPNGSRSYFPDRIPRTVNFPVAEDDPADQYARLYSSPVVDLINHLALPRYGLGNFVAARPSIPPTPTESVTLNNLFLAGTRLMGFCRTNLFKRLESSGCAFLLSVERHILRNFVFLYALEQGLPLPIGTQGAELLDTQFNDEDEEVAAVADGESHTPVTGASSLRTEVQFRARAAAVYSIYATEFAKRFKWLSPTLFTADLARALLTDSQALMQIFSICPDWEPLRDAKLQALLQLALRTHPSEKLLIFTQFADTVDFLTDQLRHAGAHDAEGAKGGTGNLTDLVYRSSPRSNNKPAPGAEELRILVATDVLSEGQDLQDCAIIVNYDLPWAIIRLIQRAGRVDRIGQQSTEVLCYSFLPADGLETIIALRSKVRRRLDENAEVIGTDETFFEGDHNQAVIDIYHEKAGLLDDEDDSEVDLSSQAYEIWKDAITADPSLAKTIPAMQPVSFSTRERTPQELDPGSGVLVYLRTATGANFLAWVNPSGSRVTESQYRILKAAECAPGSPAQPRIPNHHQLVADALAALAAEETHTGGSLGRPSGARYKTYERLQRHSNATRGTLFNTQALQFTIDEVYKYPLRESAADILNRELRANGTDEVLANLAIELREAGKLSQILNEDQTSLDPRIICSMGLPGLAKYEGPHASQTNGTHARPKRSPALPQRLPVPALFTELMGWNTTPATRTVKTVDRHDFQFTTIAEKRGYTVQLCDSIPAYPVRAKLDRLVSRDHFEHIIVFVDRETKRQVWQVSLREKGHPVKLREVVFRVGTSSGEELFQKLQQIAVPLALEDAIHLTDLTQSARDAFNRDKVTKSFFKQFEAEHKSFLKFLKGVPKTTETWYVSVLINRLMFLYFMQSKSFLDGNPTYLTDKL